MTEIKDKAIKTFRNGLNCSQAVLCAFSDKLGLDNDTALNAASGFGGGMGRLQKTCGAVTGSYMVLGLLCGSRINDNTAKKEAVYSLVQKFNDKFTELHGSTDCLSLLGTEIRSAEGHQSAKDRNLFGTVCEKCITDSIDIVNKITE
jgi:C_GCAxxG_C_C family probable redox protein